MRTTVVVPAHNAAQTLGRALSSARLQDPAPDEIIVASDGSTDQTVEIARSLGATILDLPKSNGSVARNRAAAEAGAGLLLFLDADDEWLPGKIASHLEAHASQRPSMVFDPAIRVRSSGARGGVGGGGPACELDWERLLDYRNWTSGSSFSVSKENFARAGGFNERLLKLQDVDFWIRCAHACGPARRLAHPLTLYHQSDASITSKRLSPDAYLPILFEGWPFAQEAHRRSIVKEVFLNEARTSTVMPALRALHRAGWPLGEALFWRALAFAIRNSLRGARS